MKFAKYFSWANLGLLLGIFSLFAACSDDENGVELFELGEISAVGSSGSIKAGESIIFTDNSTKVYTREWLFPGGSPATSAEQVVEVSYGQGGTYNAVLKVTFVDNTSKTIEIPIEVEGLPAPDNPQPDFTEGFALYTEYGQVGEGAAVTFETNNSFVVSSFMLNTYEGAEAYAFEADGNSDWAMGSVKPAGGALDISAYANGYYNFAIKSDSEGGILIRLQSAGQKAIIEFKGDEEKYGFKRDGEWHMLEIPISDFVAQNPALDLTAITDLMVLRSADGDIRSFNNYNFYIDNFFLSNGNTPPITYTESMGFYTEQEGVGVAPELVFEENNAFAFSTDLLTPYEGSECNLLTVDGSSDWAMASIKPKEGAVDISAFADGFYNIALKSDSEGDILLRLQSSGQKAILEFKAAEEKYGFVRDGQWHMLQIPVADFVAQNPALDLTAITDLLVFRSSDGDVRTYNNYSFYFDNFFLSK